MLLLLVVATSGGLGGCLPEVAAKNDKGFTNCCSYAASNGKPAGTTELVDPKRQPIGPKSYALYHRLKVDMTIDQVVKIAGKPQRDLPGSNTEVYLYQYEADGRVDAAFRDGKVNSLLANGPDLITRNVDGSKATR